MEAVWRMAGQVGSSAFKSQVTFHSSLGQFNCDHFQNNLARCYSAGPSIRPQRWSLTLSSAPYHRPCLSGYEVGQSKTLSSTISLPQEHQTLFISPYSLFWYEWNRPFPAFNALWLLWFCPGWYRTWKLLRLIIFFRFYTHYQTELDAESHSKMFCWFPWNQKQSKSRWRANLSSFGGSCHRRPVRGLLL